MESFLRNKIDHRMSFTEPFGEPYQPRPPKTDGRRSRRWRPILLLVFLSAVPGIGLAEVYKFKGADGRWRFSDRSPADTTQFELVGKRGATSSPGSPKAGHDLEARLVARFNPQSPVERATLSVVAIKTKLSQGSGFFVTTNGYILTNKHVVRPAGYSGIKKQKEKLDNAEENLERLRENVAARKRRLDSLQENIRESEFYMESGYIFDREAEMRRQARLKQTYSTELESYNRLARSLKEGERELRIGKRDFLIDSNNSELQRNFKIILKDESELSATLLDVSETLDLALLKLDGYRTPAVTESRSTLRQGDRVFAIGYPLGIADPVSSGVITHSANDSVMTDAQILPGNSGGPLINSAGEVVAVNAMKITSTEGSGVSQGIGVSIPFRRALEAFSRLRRSIANKPPTKEGRTVLSN